MTFRQRVGAAALVATALASACSGELRFDDTDDGATDAAAETGSDVVSPPRCVQDDACAFAGLRCDTGTGRCVECVTEGDCAGKPYGHCDVRRHVCIACRTASDCGEHQRCDVDDTQNCLDTCVDDDLPCPVAGFVCDEGRRLCVECRTSANCTGSAAGKVCDSAHGKCVGCVSNAQCPDAQPRCDRRQGRCVACVTASDCPEGEACAPDSLTCVKMP